LLSDNIDGGDGNQITVTLTGGANITLSDEGTLRGNNTGVASGGNFSADDPEATVNVFVAGPVARIEVTHLNPARSALHRLNVTDVYFSTTVSEERASDVIDGGAGDDLIDAGEGDKLTFENTNVVCFARGTMICTPCGENRIEDLEVGGRVITRDHPRERIRWHGVRTVEAQGDMAPIVLKTGTVGNRRDLVVSPLHRILLTGIRAMVHCGASEVLVTAKHLINGDTIYQREGGKVEHHHTLFDEHEIIYANGTPAESLHPAKDNLGGFCAESREELLKIFPKLRKDAMSNCPSARH
jgi:hypothetical protein